jgi:hypothetical protein
MGGKRMTHVFARLGMSSRADLMAEGARRGGTLGGFQGLRQNPEQVEPAPEDSGIVVGRQLTGGWLSLVDPQSDHHQHTMNEP